ncbi:uncharacterized protein LOC133472144 isoform X3 [Phyllopteryx taeniolatus]|uniref:uncharacterized protein LOC133472144 isoform X3 n=1 Tax=Phyllopteryx taeniolatus TaxID=161469 RepID=UPI002AD33438|nr:uncharacterized protein LOC133472144 isoform X3 [Phyllopteryx taeniolatus]
MCCIKKKKTTPEFASNVLNPGHSKTSATPSAPPAEESPSEPKASTSQSGKCCDRLVKMCARTAAYEKDLCAPKDENEPQHQLLDAAFNLQPRTVLSRPDISEDLHPEKQAPEPTRMKEEVEDIEVPHIKEEEELEPISIKKEEEEERPHVKQEKEEEDITKFPLTSVPLKSEDEGQSEESRGAEPPNSQHKTTEDGAVRG